MILTVQGMSFSYPTNEVLKDVNLSLGKGECLAVLGTNGAGKSTLLKCLNKIISHKAGDIILDGKNIHSYGRTEMAQKIGYVSQSAQFTHTTVFDAVLLGRKPYIKWDVTEHDLKVVRNVMQTLHLENFAMRYVDELSGGEIQKISIARALAQEPDVLMFDEPTSNLDMKNQLEVINIIKAIVKEKQLSAIVTMHDLNLAMRFADKYLMLHDGEVFVAGGREIISKENIAHVYDISVAIETYQNMPFVIPL